MTWLDELPGRSLKGLQRALFWALFPILLLIHLPLAALSWLPGAPFEPEEHRR